MIPKKTSAFSLIEVILAVAIFAITILALIGLLGPTLDSVREVEQLDEVASVSNTVYTFLQRSPDIAASTSVGRFETLYRALESNGSLTLFVFRVFIDPTSDDQRLEVGFAPGSSGIGSDAELSASDFTDVAGPIYRVVLTASNVVNPDYRSDDRNGDGVYLLDAPYARYDEAVLPIEVRIFAEDPPAPTAAASFNFVKTLSELADETPQFQYNLAVLR